MVMLLGGEGDYEHMHIPKDLSFLNLSPAQRQQIKAILHRYRKELKAIHKEEERWEKDLKEEFVKERFDWRKVLKKNLKIKERMAKLEIGFFKEIHKVLTKEQRKKFILHIEEWEVE